MIRAALAALCLCCAGRTPAERALAENAAALRGERAVGQGLLLTCEPKEAEVLLDAVPQGSCEDLRGRALDLEDGSHSIEIQRAGHATYRAELMLGRARTVLNVALVPSR